MKSQKTIQSSGSRLGGDPTRLTPCFFFLPYVFHLIRERYQVVPDNHRQCRLEEILEYGRLSGRILGVDRDPDLGKKASGCGVS